MITHKEATKLAQKVHGKHAYCWLSYDDVYYVGIVERDDGARIVNDILDQVSLTVLGEGSSWETALAAADVDCEDIEDELG